MNFKGFMDLYANFKIKYPPIVRLLITIIVIINLPLTFVILMLFEYYNLKQKNTLFTDNYDYKNTLSKRHFFLSKI